MLLKCLEDKKKDPTMTWRFSSLVGNSILAQDGPIGTIKDFLFDDDTWLLKWLVVDTGSWLPGRQVLIPTTTMGPPSAVTRSVSVAMSMERVKNSPGLDFDQPVSRQFESTMFGYYGLDPFIGAGRYPVSNSIAVPFDTQFAPPSERQPMPDTEDHHLRSMATIQGYHCHATDGDLGFIADILIDTDRLRVSDFVIDTGIWWPDKRVIIAPQSIAKIRWRDAQIDLRLSQATVGQSRTFDNETFIDGAESLEVIE
jgi:sporulation protein YlmC with PRC-barrel domain